MTAAGTTVAGAIPMDDEAQLRLLTQECAAPVYRLALAIVRDPALAEDVVQDTLLKAWKALPSFRGDSPLRPWVLRIGHNTAVSHLRKMRDTAMAAEDLPEIAVEPSANDDMLLSMDFAEALGNLDELSRSIVVLRELEDLPYDQIAETLGISVPLVKTRLFRARRELRDALEAWR